jgi:hypothetical protein
MTSPIAQAEIRRRAQDAKEYLIAQIVQEAQREDVPLSEIERKMLYFADSVETIPDIVQVNEQFEQEYNEVEYEAKVSHLLRYARKRVRKESPEGAQRWMQAEMNLRREDHYLGVIVENSHTPVGGFWTVAIWSTAIAAAIFGAIVLWAELDEKHLIPAWINRTSPQACAWGSMAIICVFVIIMNVGVFRVKEFFSRVRDYFPSPGFRKRSNDNR